MYLRSKGYTLYSPDHSTRIVETSDTRFENDQNSESVPSLVVAPKLVVSIFASHSIDTIQKHDDVPIPLHESTIAIQKEISIPHKPLRQFIRERRFVILDDYVVYAIKSECDLGL
ncbi:hypothetical protein V2J09_009508 [Rumex salicifolius]